MMDLAQMIDDFCRRAPGDYTPEQIIAAIKDNHILADDDCFIVFAAVQDEIHMLFPYAPRGKSIEAVRRKLEDLARSNGYKRIQIITDREKAFARKFKDYRPIGVLFEKELI